MALVPSNRSAELGDIQQSTEIQPARHCFPPNRLGGNLYTDAIPIVGQPNAARRRHKTNMIVAANMMGEIEVWHAIVNPKTVVARLCQLLKLVEDKKAIQTIHDALDEMIVDLDAAHRGQGPLALPKPLRPMFIAICTHPHVGPQSVSISQWIVFAFRAFFLAQYPTVESNIPELVLTHHYSEHLTNTGYMHWCSNALVSPLYLVDTLLNTVVEVGIIEHLITDHFLQEFKVDMIYLQEPQALKLENNLLETEYGRWMWQLFCKTLGRRFWHKLVMTGKVITLERGYHPQVLKVAAQKAKEDDTVLKRRLRRLQEAKLFHDRPVERPATRPEGTEARSSAEAFGNFANVPLGKGAGFKRPEPPTSAAASSRQGQNPFGSSSAAAPPEAIFGQHEVLQDPTTFSLPKILFLTKETLVRYKKQHFSGLKDGGRLGALRFAMLRISQAKLVQAKLQAEVYKQWRLFMGDASGRGDNYRRAGPEGGKSKLIEIMKWLKAADHLPVKGTRIEDAIDSMVEYLEGNIKDIDTQLREHLGRHGGDAKAAADSWSDS